MCVKTTGWGGSLEWRKLTEGGWTSWERRCLMGRLAKSRMKSAGHVERMKEDRLPRMAYVHQERGKRKRGRPRMRWRDCIERDMRKADCWSEESGPEEDGRAERGGWHTEVFDGKIGEESGEVSRTCRTNERKSTAKDGICSPGEGKEKERKTTYEMVRLHRETWEGQSWRTWTGGWWPRIEDSGGGSSTGRQSRVAILTPEIRETRKRENLQTFETTLGLALTVYVVAFMI